MRRGFRATVAVMVCFFSFGQTASAHRIDEYLQATMLSLDAHDLQASMRLVPGILVAPAVIAAVDSNGDGTFSASEQRAYAQHVLDDLSVRSDGKDTKPELLSWSFPDPSQMREGLGEIHIRFRAPLTAGARTRSLVLANHHQLARSVYLMNVVVPEDQNLRIVAQKRNAQQTTYEVDYEQLQVPASGTSKRCNDLHAWLHGLQFASLFHLGMRHIAGGTDHLLFLLTLLLPAPLCVAAGRWGRAAGVRQSLLRLLSIVTAFTIGHSITLTLAAVGFVHIPGHPVEVLIAVSIFVSAVHALRPIVPGKEAWIALFFGLIHGLAFAATLDQLGMGRWDRVAGILAFNLGIETMQMLVVAAVLPSLLLMSRTTAYPVLRIGGAAFAGIASLGWIVERLFQVGTPVDAIVNGLARHAVLIAVTLFVLSVACRLLLPSTVRLADQRGLLDAAETRPALSPRRLSP